MVATQLEQLKIEPFQASFEPSQKILIPQTAAVCINYSTQTFFPETDSKPARMHSFKPVPRKIASYVPSARGAYVLSLITTGDGAFGPSDDDSLIVRDCFSE